MKTNFQSILIILLVVGFFLISGCTLSGTNNSTFKETGKSICTQDNKPIIYLFSTTWCPHCQWVGPSFDEVVKEYVAQGKIIAKHWQLDTKDNVLVDGNEGGIPQADLNVYVSVNPNGTIPTFIFGCKYYRIGAGYEAQKDLEAEKREFRQIIDKLIVDANQLN